MCVPPTPTALPPAPCSIPHPTESPGALSSRSAGIHHLCSPPAPTVPPQHRPRSWGPQWVRGGDPCCTPNSEPQNPLSPAPGAAAWRCPGGSSPPAAGGWRHPAAAHAPMWHPAPPRGHRAAAAGHRDVRAGDSAVGSAGVPWPQSPHHNPTPVPSWLHPDPIPSHPNPHPSSSQPSRRASRLGVGTAPTGCCRLTPRTPSGCRRPRRAGGGGHRECFMRLRSV